MIYPLFSVAAYPMWARFAYTRDECRIGKKIINFCCEKETIRKMKIHAMRSHWRFSLFCFDSWYSALPALLKHTVWANTTDEKKRSAGKKTIFASDHRLAAKVKCPHCTHIAAYALASMIAPSISYITYSMYTPRIFKSVWKRRQSIRETSTME